MIARRRLLATTLLAATAAGVPVRTAAAQPPPDPDGAVPALGRVHHVNPISGTVRDVDAIAGHRDRAATECPGNAFHPTLPDVRRAVAALLRLPPNP